MVESTEGKPWQFPEEWTDKKSNPKYAFEPPENWAMRMKQRMLEFDLRTRRV